MSPATVDPGPMVTAVVVVHRHHGRLGGGLLVVLLLAALGYVVYRLVKRREGGGASKPEPEWPATPFEPGPPAHAAHSVTPTDPVPGPRPDRADADGPSRTTDGAQATAQGAVKDAVQDPAQNREAGRPEPTRTTTRTRSFANGEWAVETHGLTKHFGQNVAVRDVELLVPRGCAFGYLGPNGAGKTTLIRTLLGLTKADAGSMSLLGIPVPSQRHRALARVGAIVDEPRFHGHLTGQENLQLLAAARGEAAEERILPSLERVGLGERRDDRVASYSMGMRQRLGVAACLLGDPELLILDEPMNGLDPAGMHQMRSMIQSFVHEGRTVMLSSHLLDEVERTCDAVAIVDKGRVIRQGPIHELVQGASAVLEIECSDLAFATRLIEEARVATSVATRDGVLAVTLQSGPTREMVAAINRRLVEANVEVYRLQEARTSLEDWFLSVTSRLGEHQ